MRQLRICVAIAAFGWLSGACALGVIQDDAKLKAIIERIAKGDPGDYEDAMDDFLSRTLDPVERSIGSIEDRPPGEVARLRDAVGRLGAALRLRVARMDLPPEDRKLFDEFDQRYGHLAMRLFHENPRVRLAAVQQIPLDPNTGAGVALVMRIEDDDTSVYETAFAAISKLRDPVVARGLTRLVANILKELRAGDEAPVNADAELQLGYAIIAHRAILEITKCRYAEALPVVLEATRYFCTAKSGRWYEHMVPPVLMALGEFGDESVVPILRALLDDPRAAELRSPGAGSLVAQTIGDAAFLGLLKLFDFRPSQFGMVTTEGDGAITGFGDDGSRQAARAHLRTWLAENAGKPKTERSPLTPLTPRAPTTGPATTQPATAPARGRDGG